MLVLGTFCLLIWAFVKYNASIYFNELINLVADGENYYLLDVLENDSKVGPFVLKNSSCKIPDFNAYDVKVLNQLKGEKLR